MSWIAFELLLLGLGWLGVAFFREYIRQKESNTEVLGGAGIVMTILFSGLLGFLLYQKVIMPIALWLLAPIIFMGLIGFLEDSKRLSFNATLIFQVIAIYLALYTLQIDLPLQWLVSLPQWSILSAIVLGIVSVPTLLERMDKSDGFAAVQSLCILGVMAFLFYSLALYDLAILLFGLCAIISGFLIWNWPNAKITMGKSGTLLLGSLMSFLALYSYRWCHIPLQIWAILMSPFLVDGLLTAIRQIFAFTLGSTRQLREVPSCHAYERLLVIGWAPSYLLLALLVLDGALVFMALWAYKMPGLVNELTLMSFVVSLGLYSLIEWIKPMYKGWYPVSKTETLSLEAADHLVK